MRKTRSAAISSPNEIGCCTGIVEQGRETQEQGCPYIRDVEEIKQQVPRCENCGKLLLDLKVEHEETGYVCNGFPDLLCERLNFPSDFEMCEVGYTIVWMNQ